MDAFPLQFAGVKDSSGDPLLARRLGERFGKDLVVLNGNDKLFSLALQNHACGCITAMANISSPDLRRVWDAHQQGDQELEVQSRLTALRDKMGDYAPFPPLYKALVSRLYDQPRWAVRPPLEPLTEEDEQSALEAARLLSEGFEL